MAIEAERSKFSLRCTTFFGWSLPIALFFSYFNYHEPVALNVPILGLFCFLGALLAIPEAMLVLRLRRKKESKLVTLLSSAIAVIGVITLLELKRREIFIWNELYITVPYIVFALIFYAVCFRTEDKHSVRVYYALDGVHYVRA
jgi:hypothetical protein